MSWRHTLYRREPTELSRTLVGIISSKQTTSTVLTASLSMLASRTPVSLGFKSVSHLREIVSSLVARKVNLVHRRNAMKITFLSPSPKAGQISHIENAAGHALVAAGLAEHIPWKDFRERLAAEATA